MIIPITTRKIKSVKVSLFVYPPKYGYYELSVFDYELLCLNGDSSAVCTGKDESNFTRRNDFLEQEFRSIPLSLHATDK